MAAPEQVRPQLIHFGFTPLGEHTQADIDDARGDFDPAVGRGNWLSSDDVDIGHTVLLEDPGRGLAAIRRAYANVDLELLTAHAGSQLYTLIQRYRRLRRLRDDGTVAEDDARWTELQQDKAPLIGPLRRWQEGADPLHERLLLWPLISGNQDVTDEPRDPATGLRPSPAKTHWSLLALYWQSGKQKQPVVYHFDSLSDPSDATRGHTAVAREVLEVLSEPDFLWNTHAGWRIPKFPRDVQMFLTVQSQVAAECGLRMLGFLYHLYGRLVDARASKHTVEKHLSDMRLAMDKPTSDAAMAAVQQLIVKRLTAWTPVAPRALGISKTAFELPAGCEAAGQTVLDYRSGVDPNYLTGGHALFDLEDMCVTLPAPAGPRVRRWIDNETVGLVPRLFRDLRTDSFYEAQRAQLSFYNLVRWVRVFLDSRAPVETPEETAARADTERLLDARIAASARGLAWQTKDSSALPWLTDDLPGRIKSLEEARFFQRHALGALPTALRAAAWQAVDAGIEKAEGEQKGSTQAVVARLEKLLGAHSAAAKPPEKKKQPKKHRVPDIHPRPPGVSPSPGGVPSIVRATLPVIASVDEFRQRALQTLSNDDKGRLVFNGMDNDPKTWYAAVLASYAPLRGEIAVTVNPVALAHDHARLTKDENAVNAFLAAVDAIRAAPTTLFANPAVDKECTDFLNGLRVAVQDLAKEFDALHGVIDQQLEKLRSVPRPVDTVPLVPLPAAPGRGPSPAVVIPARAVPAPAVMVVDTSAPETPLEVAQRLLAKRRLAWDALLPSEVRERALSEQLHAQPLPSAPAPFALIDYDTRLARTLAARRAEDRWLAHSPGNALQRETERKQADEFMAFADARRAFLRAQRLELQGRPLTQV